MNSNVYDNGAGDKNRDRDDSFDNKVYIVAVGQDLTSSVMVAMTTTTFLTLITPPPLTLERSWTHPN